MNSEPGLDIDGRSRGRSPLAVTRRSFLGLAIGAALSVGLAACGDQSGSVEVQQAPQAQVTDTPTTAAEPTVATQAPATPTDAPANTPRPAATAAPAEPPPTASPTVEAAPPPTATPMPQPTSTPTEAPAPAATPTAASTAAPAALPLVEPYDPQIEQSIYDRYAVDAARLDAVLAAGYPILLVTDAIW